MKTPTPGELLLGHGHAKEALPFLRETLEATFHNPVDHAGALNNLAIAHRLLGNFGVAETLAHNAIRVNKLLPNPWSTLGMILEDLGDFTGAEKAHAQAMALCQQVPPNQHLAINHAYALMRLERFEEAWPLWEYGRFLTSWAPVQPASILPLWNGRDDLNGKSILIVREGGYGDAIMFSRWFPWLEELGAKVIFYVWPRLKELCRQWPGVDGVFTDADGNLFRSQKSVADFQCGLMSLPALLYSWGKSTGMATLVGIPPMPKWPNPFRSIASSVIKRVGLCWRAEENGTTRRHRSVNDIDALAPLGQIEGIEWVNLCPGGKELHTEDAFPSPDWLPICDTITWEGTAKRIADLDLVITVDTAVAHLAGAIGVPTWVLVPMRSDWKMFIERDDSPWYPSWRLFRQDDPLKWDGVIERVAKELEGLRV